MTTAGSQQNNAQYARGGYQTNDNHGRPIYKPYNEGLQYTSNGFRYEMSGETAHQNIDRFIPDPSVNQETFITELDGTPVYAKYYGTDIQGNRVYGYTNDESTMLGEIEPTKFIENGYGMGAGRF
jgi:hypothetical protein